MSIMETAPADSTAIQTAPRPSLTRSRTTLFVAGAVLVKIPANAKFEEFAVDGGQISFLRFSRNVPGGAIRCFLHTDDPDSYLGHTVRARAEVIEKELVDDRKFLSVDYHLVEVGTELTHRLAVVSKDQASQVETADENHVFFAPELSVKGAVVIIPPDAKLPETATAGLFALVQKKTPSASSEGKVKFESTGDGQLDRLLQAGWTIYSENERTVFLSKGEGIDRKAIEHQRSQKKVRRGH